MARLVSPIELTGPIGNLSFYKRRDSDKIIIRQKGGASKEKIKTAEGFWRVRRNITEFGGRSTATKHIRYAIEPLRGIADYNIFGPLNNLLKPIQELDTTNERGKRNVLISSNPQLLEGFNFNKKYPFDTMVMNPIQWSLSKETLSGSVEFPALLPGNNFTLPQGNYPYFSLKATLGVIPDIFYYAYGQHMHDYNPVKRGLNLHPAQVASEWYPVSAGSPGQKLELKYRPNELPDSYSVILAAGVCFGKVERDGSITSVKYVGCAKIVGMA